MRLTKGETSLSPAIDAMFVRLRKEAPSFELQGAVVNLVAQCLEHVKTDLGYRQKECMACAIAALTRSLASAAKPTKLWLRLALVRAEQAFDPNDEKPRRRDEAIEALTYGELAGELQQLRARS